MKSKCEIMMRSEGMLACASFYRRTAKPRKTLLITAASPRPVPGMKDGALPEPVCAVPVAPPKPETGILLVPAADEAVWDAMVGMEVLPLYGD